MRAAAAIGVVILLSPLARAGDKLTFEDRIELTRGLTAEYATVKVLLPRSKKALEFNSDGTYDKSEWSAIAKDSGPAARNGDLVQITKIDIDSDRIVLQINGGYKGGRHWYQGVQMGVNGGSSVPVSTNNDTNAPGGTSIEILFHKPLEPIKAAAVKKMLAPVLDFEKRSATEIFSETLAPRSAEGHQRKARHRGHDSRGGGDGDGTAGAQIARDQRRDRNRGLGLRAGPREDHFRDVQGR